MRAITVAATGEERPGPDALTLTELPDPEPGPGEVALKVAAAGVNRADSLQRQGLYPPPEGASEVIGLECSGTVAALGEGVEKYAVGDEVCALLAGGGYAERVVVPAGQLMPLPPGVDLVTAAALPEVACTVWSNVYGVAGLRPGERFLVHGGAGGIGTFAIQLASALGSQVYATAGSSEKLGRCRELGAHRVIDYHDEDFVEVLRAAGGADVVLDNMGAKYLDRNVSALAIGGRLVIIGMMGGVKGELTIARLLTKRGSVHATSLRGRPVDDKAEICARVVEHVWPLVADRRVVPVIHDRVPLDEARRAHRLMEESGHIGKILLTP